MRPVIVWLPVACLLAVACEPAGDGEPAEDLPRAGGDTTVFDRTSNAFAFPAPNLGAPELERHLRGDALFDATFVLPPAKLNPGLGPLFNNDGCVRCHVGDGRGVAAVGHGPLGSLLLVRVSLLHGTEEAPGGPIPAGAFGTQIQDHAVFGVQAEADVSLDWSEERGSYADGEPFSLRRPTLTLTRPDGLALPEGLLTSPRAPQPVFGLGLLEAVAERDVLALADPDDADGDGVSGRPNRVWDVQSGEARLGRFGWKANTPTLLQQSAAAFANDMGVTTPLFPEPDGGTELDREKLYDVAFYTQTLAVPARVGQREPAVRAGERLFRELGCASCHVETLRTDGHAMSALADQTIHPYTDLLLHDMGPGLADGRPDFLASGTEWRTPPLWGLGLTQTVQAGSTFLHDGRARTLDEAILWHGGEAAAASERFRQLPAVSRAALLAFLRSL